MNGPLLKVLLLTLLLYAVAFLLVWFVPAEGEPNVILCLAPVAPLISLLLSFERAFLVNRVAARRFHTANAAVPFLKNYATLFAAAVAGSIAAAVILTTAYDHVLNTSSDSNTDPRVAIIWGIGYLLVPLVPILLGWGAMRLIRKFYGLTTRQSWTVWLISLIPDLILFIIGAIIFITVIVPLIEKFGEAVS